MLSKLFVSLVFVLFSTICAADYLGSPGPPVEGSFKRVFGEDVVDTIYDNRGGRDDYFLLAAEEVLKNGRYIKIDGECHSACVLFADKARPNVCITGNAVFRFHMQTTRFMHVLITEVDGVLAYQETLLEFRDPMTLSDDIDEWVMKHGGYPKGDPPDIDSLLKMDSKEVSAFWPMCK